MKLIDLSDYNHASKRYWYAMVTAGTLISAWAAYRCLAFSSLQVAEFLALLGCAIVAGSKPISIPNTKASVTIGDTFTFLSILFLGVPAGILIAVVDAFVSSHRTSKRRVSWIAAPAMVAVSVFVAGNCFYFALAAYGRFTSTVPAPPFRPVELLVPMALMALAYYFLNGLTIATMFALKDRRAILPFWRDGYLWTSWSFFAAAIASGVIYTGITHFGVHYAM